MLTGEPDLCWTVDIWTHTTGKNLLASLVAPRCHALAATLQLLICLSCMAGACWLKHQSDWDGNFDLAATNLEVNSRGALDDAFRREHTTAPEKVAWVAGMISYKKPG